MMARLLQALPQDARLILLGDRDQLSSVEAGNVLGDMTGLGKEIIYQADDAARLAAWSGIDVEPAFLKTSTHAPDIMRSIALLRTSHRFDGSLGIGSLARCVNTRDDAGALHVLRNDASGELTWHPEASLHETLQHITNSYRHYMQHDEVADALQAFEQCRVLCAVRQGEWGVERINQQIQTQLFGEPHKPHEGMHGMPIMIRRNHYDLNLFNGDTGLIWMIEGKLYACFQDSEHAGSTRQLPLHLLPHYDPCWAMTVHQSQGSEFEQVFLILPEQDTHHHMLNKELVYTAITRAKSSFHLHASIPALQTSIRRPLQRSSGLAERLGWCA